MGKKTQIAVSFDTTGSMYGCLSQVRESVQDLVCQLFKQVPDLEVSVIAHGDYCDRGHPYITKILQMTSNQENICRFVRDVERTSGGDADECYELVLKKARTELTWQAGATKALVVIGDAMPHAVSYPDNVQRIDWKNELDLLLEAGIQVYGVHALASSYSAKFYETIAEKTNGFYLKLDQFALVEDLLMAVIYKQAGNEMLEIFEQAVESAGRMSRSHDEMFATLLKRKTRRYKAPKLVPVEAGRFQVLPVRKDTPIREFVEKHGIVFEKGRGFYQLGSREKGTKIQDYKEIIVQEKTTGDLFSGDKVRDILGLPKDESVHLNNSDVARLTKDYTIFVQSTSVNRKLIKGTLFMYDLIGK